MHICISAIYSPYKTTFFFEIPDTLNEVSNIIEATEIGEN
jgi:hypothetical protein